MLPVILLSCTVVLIMVAMMSSKSREQEIYMDFKREMEVMRQNKPSINCEVELKKTKMFRHGETIRDFESRLSLHP